MKRIHKGFLCIGLALSIFIMMLGLTVFAGGTTETMIQDNSADTLDAKWAGSADGAAVVSLDTTDKLGFGNSAKVAIDRSKNEYSMGTVNYNYETNINGSDGIRFTACADQPMALRVAVVLNWKQRYADVTIGTEPKIYTIRWEDCKDYNDPFDVNGAGSFNQVIFQNGRTYEDPMTNVLYLDELKYFTGDAATNLSGEAVPAATTTTEKITTTTEKVTTTEATATTTEATTAPTAQPDIPDTGSADCTMIQDNSAAALDAKWAGSADGAAVVTLDTADKLGFGNSAKVAIDRSKNEYSMGTVSYNYETNINGSDGVRFTACADQPMTLRVAAVFDWSKQRYADVSIGTEPRTYTIRWEDGSTYDGVNGFDVAGSGHFTQVFFQNGRTYEDPMTNVLYLDELSYFTGDAATNLTGSKPVKPEPTQSTGSSSTVTTATAAPMQPDVPDTGSADCTVIQDNSAAALDAKWAGSADGAAVVTLDTTDKLGFGNSAKVAIDRSKNEYSMGTVSYNYETNIEGSDGIRFTACADQPMTLRVAAVFDWSKQRYADVSIGTEPRTYTIRWEDGSTYDGVNGFDVAGSGHFTQVFFQNGRTYEDPMTNVLYLDELSYFTGDAATNLIGSKPVKPEPVKTTATTSILSVYDKAKKTVIEDFEKLTALDEIWFAPNKSAVLSLDTTGKLGGSNSLKAELKRSEDQYNVATINYNLETRFQENYDGIAFTACVDSACEMRVALALTNYGQVYADVQLTPEKTQYVIRFSDMKSYDKYEMPKDLAGTDFHQIIFQIGRMDGETNQNGPDENVLYVDDITLFVEQAGSVNTGETSPVVPAAALAAVSVTAAAVTLRKKSRERK